MNAALKKLRKKYVITASLIAFIVILLMVFVLNLLMSISYRNERQTLEEVISQAAFSQVEDINTEIFELKDLPKDKDGNYIISRNIAEITYITLHGSISCDCKTAMWYNAGGGILFFVNKDDKTQLIYKEFAFNKDTTNIVIDIEKYENMEYNDKIVTINEDEIDGSHFLFNPLWWSSSSEHEAGRTANVELIIDSLEVHYRKPISNMKDASYMITHSNFSDIFDNKIPKILSTTTAFYFAVDENNNLISVNDGNLINPLDNEKAKKYISQIVSSNKKNGTIKTEYADFRFSINKSEPVSLMIFTNTGNVDYSQSRLMFISIVVGVIILVIMFVLIFIISGYVIKPVAENFQQQKEFISNASHELKTPVTVISATIDILNRQIGENKWLDCIREQSDKMQVLVCELLDLSRLSEHKNQKENFKICDISNLTRISLLYFESRFFETKKILEQDIQSDITIQCDKNKISQLIGILIDNAIKYSDEGSKIKFSLKKQKDLAVFTCENQCSNFLISDTSKMFNRFYRSDDDHSNKQNGFGLGLSIAQAITQLHSGKISAEYKENTVYITISLPIKK